MEVTTPSVIQKQGGYLSEPGIYHVVINNVLVGESSKGKSIDGITITVEVFAGTVDGQVGKTKSESLFAPSQKDVEKEEKTGCISISREKIINLYLATGLMQPSELGANINPDDSKMIGSQAIMKFVEQKELDEHGHRTISTGNLQLSYADIFHVDDPEVSDIPKSSELLSLISKDCRHNEQWFSWKKKRVAPSPNRQPVAAGSGSDLNDLFQ
jgi:hypothetical protein